MRLFKRPLVAGANLTNQQEAAVFSDLEALRSLSLQMITALTLDGEPVSVLATAFVTIAPFFRMYSQYCANYESAIQVRTQRLEPEPCVL